MAAVWAAILVLGVAASDPGQDCVESCVAAQVSDPVLLQIGSMIGHNSEPPDTNEHALLSNNNRQAASADTPWKGVKPKPRAPVKGLHGKEPFLSKDLPKDSNNTLENYTYSDKYPKENALLANDTRKEASLLDVGGAAPVKGLKGEEPFLDKDLPADAKNDLDDFSRKSKYEAPPKDVKDYYEPPTVAPKEDKEKKDKDKKTSLLDVGGAAPVKGLKGEEPFLDKDLPADAENDLDDFSRKSKYEAPPKDVKDYYEPPTVAPKEDKDKKDKGLPGGRRRRTEG